MGESKAIKVERKKRLTKIPRELAKRSPTGALNGRPESPASSKRISDWTRFNASSVTKCRYRCPRTARPVDCGLANGFDWETQRYAIASAYAAADTRLGSG
jgi:hypothetical protein